MDSSSDSDRSPCLAIDNLRIINLRKKESHRKLCIHSNQGVEREQERIKWMREGFNDFLPQLFVYSAHTFRRNLVADLCHARCENRYKGKPFLCTSFFNLKKM